MKKITLTAITLLSVITLAACSSSKTETTKSNESTTTTQSEPKKSEVAKVDNSQYDEIVAEIKSTLDPNSTGEISVEIENNVIDSEYPDGHNIIRILLTGEAKKAAEELLSASYSNTATTEQQNALTMFRFAISEFAKKLPDDTTTISLGYEISADQYDLIALSSKTKDIIPVGELVIE